MIENLRDENIQLEENLFYNHQDLEMYEMRLSKYQGMYNQVESQCGTLKKELQALEAQKYEKDVFVQDLSEHLAECQKELADLFSVLVKVILTIQMTYFVYTFCCRIRKRLKKRTKLNI